MKLYPKKIDGVAALRKEKHRLRQEILATGFPGLSTDHIAPDNIPSKQEETKKQTNTEEAGNDDILNSILSIFGDASSFSPIIDIATPFIKKYAGKKINQMAWVVAKDVLLGYAKWKAVELSFKGVKWFINNRKKKA